MLHQVGSTANETNIPQKFQLLFVLSIPINILIRFNRPRGEGDEILADAPETSIVETVLNFSNIILPLPSSILLAGSSCVFWRGTNWKERIQNGRQWWIYWSSKKNCHKTPNRGWKGWGGEERRREEEAKPPQKWTEMSRMETGQFVREIYRSPPRKEFLSGSSA